LILSREANAHGERIGGYEGLPPLEWVAVADDDGKRFYRKDYQGDVKLGQVIDDVLLLRQLLHAAHTYERKKVTPKDKTNRRERDEAMPKLFNNLVGIWFDCFDDVPTVTWNAHASDAGGTFIAFLLPLFQAFKRDMPLPVNTQYPKLAGGLPVTRQAIYSRYRSSVAPKIARLAARMV
jgi:hypothetical protein